MSQVEGLKTIFDLHWLVTTRQGVEHFVEHVELWLYTREEMVIALESAGFEVSFLENGLMEGRGLYVAKRPDASKEE